MRHRRRAARRGFTILEVLIANAMLIAVIASIASVFAVARAQYANQRDIAQASFLASQFVEAAILWPATSAGMSPTETHPPVHYTRDGRLSASPAVFKLTWKIVADRPIRGMRELNVLVDWSNAGTPHQVGFTTWRE